MKIVFQHDHPLPVKKYGGIERMLFWHMKELVKQGHEVKIIGHPQTELSSFGIELIPMHGKEWHHLIPNDTDIIHLSYNHIVPSKIPTIVTLHGNGQPGEIFPENTIFLSRKHAENHNGIEFVYNGIDFSEYPFMPKRRNWENFLFLAKASWKVKNLKHCLKAIKATNKKLDVVGGSSIIPKKNTTFHGFLDGKKKLDLIQYADCFLWPVRWHEPFGLAVVEAMSQGVPTIASPFGSLKELINEDNGVLVNNYEEFVTTIKDKPKEFNAKKIRKDAEERFSIEKYTKDYVSLYVKVIDGEKLHHSTLSWKHSTPPQELLDF